MYKEVQLKSLDTRDDNKELVVLGKGTKDVVVRMTINATGGIGINNNKEYMLRVWMVDTEDFANKEWRWPMGLTTRERDELYKRVSWDMLMSKTSVEFHQFEWNYAALRALLLTLAATHKKDFSEFTLDLQNDRWWHDSAPLDAEPCGPYVPRVTDAPRRSASSSASSAPSAVSGLNRSSESHALRPPRALFRTSRLSEEEPPKSCAARLGSYQRPHKISEGDTLCDGMTHYRLSLSDGFPSADGRCLGPCNCVDCDSNLPLEPAFPISPMMQEPVTPVYLD